VLVEIGLGCTGCALITAAIAAGPWLDRHFLPAFFISRATFVKTAWLVRITAIVLGLMLAVVARRRIARVVSADWTRVFVTLLAIVLAFGAAELMLRRTRLRAAEEVPPRKEPLRHLDPRVGWLFVPSHVGYQSNNGRRVQYVFDGNGYRVPSLDQPVDFERPSIVFTGESIMVGEKLPWSETIPAQTCRLLGVQSANIAVSGFATDQAYLRLASELPRFRQPLAVVFLFAPSILDRNLDDDRPHLVPGLVWQPPAERWRLLALARRIVRYRSDESIERGIATTREILGAAMQLARARGATPLIVVPRFGPEQPREHELRVRILDQSRLPYVEVELDPRWRVPDDGHPDARGAQTIAAAIAARLRSEAGTTFATRALP